MRQLVREPRDCSAGAGGHGRPSRCRSIWTNVALPGLGPPPPEPVARATDPDGALHELFGFESFRPGPARGGGGRARGPRRAGRHADGLGQVALLPAAGADADGPDAGRLAARVADAGPGARRSSGSRPAASRSSTPSRTRATNRRAVERAAAGQVRLLYVAPERFASPGFLERIRHAEIGLFVVDEAHCVSQWGHDFRPDYFRLADAARWLGAKAITASTATATPQVAADIVARLGLRDPVRVATGFDRPNLSFAVVPCTTKEAVHRGIAAALAEPGALPGDRLRGHARGERPAVAGGWRPSWASRRSPTTRAWRATSARRRSGASWPARSRSWWRPTRSAWASTRRTCGRSATRASRARSRPTTRRRAARGATASRRAACCSRRAATRACTSSSSSARRSTTTS